MDDSTRLAGEAATPKSGSGSDWGRFPPGTLLAGRFRIVAPLGRGGMGEVYRADDLRLGQAVALKFLPEPLAADPARLAQFHNEVRVARTISHRNVCRTYDIGDADGRPFLTMEYVDGEDLASLLRRVGRLPQDRAVEVARQICAGLAAAHDGGVLHRDLKPANVMIDGDGHARLTDFGLAALAGTADDVRAGTPAYMAPEQLAGREVTVRSDLYALGLVLFELFTGQRAFEAKTLNELIELHDSGAATTPSSIVRDLDPAIERAVMRCLEKDPARRPVSALAVAASLPGGNQLEAALAAGETPSPEMVAAAGERTALQPVMGLALVAFTLVMLGVMAVLSQRFSIVHQIPLPRSTDSLHDKALEIVERLGYRAAPHDTAHGWSFSREYLTYAGRDRPGSDAWPDLTTGRTGTLTFWLRTSPVTLVSGIDSLLPGENDPPFQLPEMRFVRLDAAGRLLEFHSLPPPRDEAAAPAGAPDWSALFDSAGLSVSDFHPVDPQWLPRSHADTRVAWEGPFPEVAGATARVEAAAYRGRPVYFGVIAPWSDAARAATPQPRTLSDLVVALALVLGLLVAAAGALLARRHLRTGRGDRRGAFRTAAMVFVAQTAGYLVHARHYTSLDVEYARVTEIVALTLLTAAGLWLLYLALEPYARRFWPQLLIGWTRLLSGRLRDPLVGRDVLFGTAAGVVAGLMIWALDALPRLLSRGPTSPFLTAPVILLGTRYTVALGLEVVPRAFTNAIQCLGVVVLLRIVVKRTWLVLTLSVVAMLPIAMRGLFTGDQALIQLPIFLAGVVLMFAVLLRFGLLSLLVAFTTMHLITVFPLTTDLSRPYAGTSIVLMLGIAAFSGFGFYASRGDEPLFGRTLLD